ncbi:hemagglutinin repeat-containing protein [Chitinibacter sp. S2-10]|uniref:hemagglutinin repeat-containing protein n=1 Tax=Chitinibacter sp. S2-10 TaxID=3373597 RepID=UPI003977D542
MNKNIYRIVFNKARGQLMAVAENVCPEGKTSTAGSGTAEGRFSAWISPLRMAVLWVLGCVAISPVSLAAVKVDPTAPHNQQPTVLRTANGIEQVNIQTPSTGGVSRNTYSQFDVDRKGVILNNSRADVQTQLTGWVQANPWLAAGSARIILNEVNSANPSYLNGFIEVAGQSAQVVIANPAGISCDGCGFINANRATLTTGTAIMNNGNLEGFRVRKGTVSFTGDGMNANQPGFTDIIARAVQVNAGIWAQQLNVTAGSGDYQLSTGQSTQTTGTGATPSFGIDVSALGGMYANKIKLVGTESGLGVRNAGQIGASAGEVTVTADGRLVNSGLMRASQQVTVSATQITNQGTIYAQGTTQLASETDIVNHGVLAGQQALRLNAGTAVLQGENGSLLAGLNDKGQMTGNATLNVRAGQNITAAGMLVSSGTQQWQSPQLNLTDSQLSAASLSAQGDQIQLDGVQGNVHGALVVNASDSISTQQASISAGQLSLHARQLDNRDGELLQTGSTDLTLDFVGRIDNRGGRIAANANNLTLRTGELLNDGASIEHAGSGTLAILSDNQHGDQSAIASAGHLNLSGQTLQYTNSTIQGKTISLTHDNATLDGSALASTGQLQVSIGQTLSTRDASISAEQLTVSATTLNNQGGEWLQSGSGDTQFNVATRLDNTAGRIASNGDNLTINAAELVNDQANIEHAGTGALTIQSASQHGHQVVIASAGNLQLSGQTLDYTQSEIQAKAITLTHDNATLDGSTLISSGALTADVAQTLSSHDASIGAGQITVNADKLNNQGGEWLQSGAGDTQFNIATQLDNTAGRIASNGNQLGINTAELLNNQASIEHAGSGSLMLTTNRFDNSNGELISLGHAQLDSASVLNQQGVIQARQLTVQGDTLDNRQGQILQTGLDSTQITLGGTLDNRGGTIASSGDTTLTMNAAGALDNSDGGLIQAQNLTILNGTLTNRDGQIVALDLLVLSGLNTLDNSTGTLLAQNRLTLQSGDLNNQNGTIAAMNGDLQLNVASINNDQGKLLAAGTLQLDSAAALDNHQGIINGQQVLLDTNGQTLNNAGGTINASDSLSLGSASLDNTSGQIQSGGDLTLQTGNIENRGGLLYASRDMTLHSDTLNNDGKILAGQNIQLAADTLNNLGGQIQASGDISLTADRIDNQASLIRAGGSVQIDTDSLDNRNTDSGDTGIAGGSITLTTTNFDNRSGTIQVDQALNIRSSGTIQNNQGLLAAKQMLDIRDTGSALAINNDNGQMQSGGTLSLNVASYGGTGGRLASLGDLSLSMLGNYTNNGTIESGSNLNFTTTGQFSNAGLIRSGLMATIQAGSIDNQANGEINGGAIHLVTNNTLTNRGLIDGGLAWLEVGTLNNLGSGRIYGDHIAIQSSQLLNTVENGTAATIAARDRLDLGVGTLTNSEHGLIFSMGDMSIGGSLDANQQATGKATRIKNLSATIESLGNMAINAQTIENRDLHLVLGDVQTGTSNVAYYQVGSNQYQSGQVSITPAVPVTTIPYDGAPTYLVTPDGQFTEWDQVSATRTVSETKVLASDAAKIIAGGDMQLNGGTLLNDNSQILAGRTLSMNLVSLQNIQASGTRTVEEHGTKTSYWSTLVFNPGCGQCGFPGGNYRLDSSPGTINSTSTTNITISAGRIEQGSAIVGPGTTIAARDPQQIDVNIASTGNVQVQGSSVTVQGPVVGSAPQGRSLQQQGTRLLEVPLKLDGSTDGGVQTIRTLQSTFTLPDNSLFKTNTKPGSRYLVETDPRFTNQKKWLSSDYLLDALAYDPDVTQKRLGDGFYEQKLVREQIAQLTGARFLGDYSNDDEQYRALMDNGVAFAKAHNLRPGVALTPEQMAQLTGDMVWLVEQEVTLPDGSTTKVLVPQVYAKVREGDLDGSGSLIAGRDINIKLDGLLNNNGTLGAKNNLELTAKDIELTGGRARADEVSLSAQNDLKQLGGLIEGLKEVQLNAGRDIVIASNSRTLTTSVETSERSAARLGGSITHGSANTVGDRTGISVLGDGGTLIIKAGRDLTLTAANISNSGEDGQTQISAERDLTLATASENSESQKTWQKANNWRNTESQTVQGSNIDVTGDLTLSAGHDLSATAANIRSDEGAINLSAGHDVSIVAGMDRSRSEEMHQYTSKGLLSKKTTTTLNESDVESAVGSTISGDSVRIQSGHDLDVFGSNVVATDDVTLKAGNDLTIAAVTENYTEHQFKEIQQTGLFSNGGFSITYGKQKQSTDTQITGSQQSLSGSLIGSQNGNITLIADNGVKISGSDVSTLKGDINVLADHIQIDTGRDQERRTDTQKFEQSGITVAVSAPMLTALESAKTALDMTKTAADSKDSRVSLIAGATAGLAGKNAFDAMQGMGSGAGKGDGGGNVSISITYGESKSESTSVSDTLRHSGSTLNAGGNVTLIATGSGKNSDINVIGSELNAGKDLTLVADGDITLTAAQDTDSMHSKNKSSSWGAGVAITVGKGGGIGFTANGSIGRGHADGEGLTWQNSHATAGDTLTIISGGDTNLIGAVAKGEQIIADIGGNLNIESLQDLSKYDSKQMNASASVTVGIGFSGSASYSKEKINADYAAVGEQSGLMAGDGGFDITVKGNTDLKGAIIASTADATNNSLTTGTITVSNIENHSKYDASSVGIGGGFSISGDTMGQKSDPDSNLATVADKNGTNTNVPIFMSGSGDDRSTTYSAISDGNITITNADAQQKLTGKSVEDMIASIRRDTGDTGGQLANNFDKEQIDEAFKVTEAFINEAGTFMANRAKEADQKKAEMEALPAGSPEREQAKLAYDEAAKWLPGGEYGRAMTVLQAAVGGNVTDGISGLVQNAAVGYLQSLATEQVKKIADDLNDETARTALHAIVGCAGAAATGQNCGAGALGAASSVLLNNLISMLDDKNAENMTAEEKENRKNLVTSLVAGIAAVAGANATAANTAALIEMENNSNVKNAVKGAINDAKKYISENGKKGLEKTAELLEKLEVQSMVEKRDAISNYINEAASRGGLSEPELAALAMLYAANEVFFPTSVVDVIPGLGKVLSKSAELIKIGVKAEKVAEIASVEMKAAEAAKAASDLNIQASKNVSKVTAPIDFDGHILATEVSKNGKKITGGHSIATGQVDVQTITKAADKNGVYEAIIQIPDPANSGKFLTKKSTMFPDSWSADRVKVEVDAAYKNKTISPDSPNMWIGFTPSGVKVTGYLTPKTTVYPLM